MVKRNIYIFSQVGADPLEAFGGIGTLTYTRLIMSIAMGLYVHSSQNINRLRAHTSGIEFDIPVRTCRRWQVRIDFAGAAGHFSEISTERAGT